MIKTAQPLQRGNVTFLVLFLIAAAAMAGVLIYQVHQTNDQLTKSFNSVQAEDNTSYTSATTDDESLDNILAAPAATPTVSKFNVSDDTSLGHLTAENTYFKLVWHYLYLPSEQWNQGGGNIYELYDKRNDPNKQNNMVGVAVEPNSNGGVGPQRPGFGGLGSTKSYFSINGAYHSSHDNTLGYGNVPESHSFSINPTTNNLTVNFQVLVKSSDGTGFYRIIKKWVVTPNGEISLTYNWTFLSTISVNEPDYNFSLNPSYGWSSVKEYGHSWNNPDPGTDGLHNPNNIWNVLPLGPGLADKDWSPLTSTHTQIFKLPPSTSSSSKLIIRMDNNNRGFESGGLFKLGYNAWGKTSNVSNSEFSRYLTAAHGYVVRWFAWWGGGDQSTNPERYQTVAANTSFSDTLKIKISH